jgi:hypothetical protein
VNEDLKAVKTTQDENDARADFLPPAVEGEKPLEQVLAMTNMQSLSSLSNGLSPAP